MQDLTPLFLLWFLQKLSLITQGTFLFGRKGTLLLCANMGEFLTLADIAVGCTLGYLDLRFPEIDWRRSQPHLSELYDRLMQRTAFVDTAPKA